MNIRKLLSDRRVIIAGSGAVVLLAAAIFGLTTAYFQDVETSVGNRFVAGDFDLMIDSTCTYNGQPQAFCTWLEKDLEGELFFNFGDVKPSDNGEDTVSFHIIDNDAWLCAEIGNLVNQDNGCRKPEQKVDSTCGNPGIGEGELQDNILFTVWKDTDCDNKLDPEIPGNPGTPGYCAGEMMMPCGVFSTEEECMQRPECMWFDPEQLCIGEWYVNCDIFPTEEECNQPEPGCYWVPGDDGTPGQSAEQILVQDKPAKAGYWAIADSTTGSPIPGNSTICYGVKWNVPLATSNIIQSDSVVGNLTFSAVQSRGMDTFKCSDLYVEICGDGIDNDYDGEIDEDCVVCGDGIIGGEENCDDGNVNPGDGCDPSCNIEPGWQCTGEPSVCTQLTCAPGCEPFMNGDGHCDAVCENIPCDWDGGDCECVPGCYPYWISDGYCDPACNNATCKWDGGDCGGCTTDEECDDGLYCNGVEYCGAQNQCVSPGSPCPGPDGDYDCSETCNEATDDCSANDPNGSACLGGTCSSGICVGIPTETICDDGLDNDADGTIDCDDSDCVNDPFCINNACGDGICGPNENSENCADDCPYNIWINEIHYDNVGVDTNEGVEIAGPAGTDLTGWTVVFYNGSVGPGMAYFTLNLSGVISNQQAGHGTLWFAVGTGIQNGAPDGLALVAPGNVVIQFLSYEGSFTAIDGPANGMMSVDIGVAEIGNEPPGLSLQLQGLGNKYADFIWVGPEANTYGLINTNQVFGP